MKYAISELDIFYISYDEPNAEATYESLCAQAPRPIKRVHGVKGFDAAHRMCAEASETPRFVTIDGDNMIHNSLFFQRIDDAPGRDLVFSFKAKNIINGLEYGNGGVKVWPRGLVLQVPTHEHAKTAEASTDFCWTYRYMQVDHLASYVHCNQSPLQAFRAGYREGVKMTLIDGLKLASWEETASRMYPPNFSRLLTWMSVGADVDNGWWAIYGARQGFADTWLDKEPVLEIITDYDWFSLYFESQFEFFDPEFAAKALGRKINKHLGLEIADLDESQSRWFKQVYLNPSRQGIMIPSMAPVDFEDD